MVAKIIITIIILVIVFVLFIVVKPEYSQDLASAQGKLSSQVTTIIQTPIAPVEYLRTGSGQPILMSHGLTGGFDQGLGLAKVYVGDGYDLIAVSRFGYLGSPLPAVSTPAAQADAYKHLLDNLNIDQAYIFGNSAGGTSAIQFAIKYPERCKGLILVSSNVPMQPPPKLAPKPLMKVVFGGNLVYWLFVKAMGENMLTMAGVPKSLTNDLSQSKKEELLDGVILGGLPINRRTDGIINDMYLSNPDINQDYPFEAIKVPVLMFSAKDDSLCLYEGALTLKTKIPQIDLVSYNEGGHLLLGHEKEIQMKIAEFVQ